MRTKKLVKLYQEYVGGMIEEIAEKERKFYENEFEFYEEVNAKFDDMIEGLKKLHETAESMNDI